MKGVSFGNYHSYDSWGLILSSKEIQSPAPKTNHVEVEGGDGVLDYTEYFGDVKYNNRTLSFTFTAWKDSQADFLTLYSDIHNAIHGKKMKVILDDDSEFYYFGRVRVNEWKMNKKIQEITIEVDAEPYKMKNALTSVSVTGEKVLQNLRKRVVPTITASASCTILFEGNSFIINEGTHTIPEIELKQGENVVEVQGTATFSYREGGI